MTFRKGAIANPMGRKPTTLDDAALETIELLASKGSHETSIAFAVRLDPRTFAKALARDRRVANALARGRAAMHDTLVTALVNQKDRGPVASIFLLKARFNYSDQGDGTGETRPQVIINLPSAVPLERFEAISGERLPALPDPVTKESERG